MFYDDAPESDAHGAPEDPLSARLRRFLPRVTDRVKALRDRFRSVDGTAADGLGASDREYVEKGARRITDADLDTVVQ